MTTVPSLEILLRRVRDIPALPQVVNQAVDLMGKPQSSAAQIAAIIALDVGLTTKILRMVNSAAYGFNRQISSVQHGIMLLGFNTVRGIVLSTSIVKLFQANQAAVGLDHQAFWYHSLATAVSARTLAQVLRWPQDDDPFSVALLHDIGKVVLDVYASEWYRPLFVGLKHAKREPHGSFFLQAEQHHLGLTHAQVGAQLAQKWRLPEAMVQVIANHHAPEQANESERKLVHLIAIANQLSHVMTAPLVPTDPHEIATAAWCDAIGLTPALLIEAIARIRAEKENLDELMNSLQLD